MNGFFIVDSDTGATLVTQVIDPSLGVPGLDPASVGPTVAALIFGLSANAAAALGIEDDTVCSDAAPEGCAQLLSAQAMPTNVAPLPRLSTPEFAMHIAKFEAAPVLCCVFVRPECEDCSGGIVGERLAAELLREFLRTFGTHYITEVRRGAATAGSYKKGFLPLAKAVYANVACDVAACVYAEVRALGAAPWCAFFYSPEIAAALHRDDPEGGAASGAADATRLSKSLRRQQRQAQQEHAGPSASLKATLVLGYDGSPSHLLETVTRLLASVTDASQLSRPFSSDPHPPSRLCVLVAGRELVVYTRGSFFAVLSAESPSGPLLMADSAHAFLADAFRTVYLSDIQLVYSGS